MANQPPGDNDNKPKPGFMAGLSKAVREISAEIKKDLNNTPPPGTAKSGEGGSSYKAPDGLAKAVGAAQGGVAFMENPVDNSPAYPAPLQPTAPAAKPLNPWAVLKEPGNHKRYGTDAYYHAYTTADLNHYIQQLPPVDGGGAPTISLICTEAGDEGLRVAFQNTLRNNAGLFGATGFSPRNVQADIEALDTTLTSILNNNPKILAVGPVGLDLAYTSHNLAQQVAQLKRQLDIANDFGLPVLMFQNGALTELRDLMEQGVTLPQKRVWLKPIHSAEELDFIQEYNFYVVFRAEITWPKETFYREAIKQVLPHRWLVGSGNSLKTTHNRAGQFNSAASLDEITTTLAELLNVDLKQLRDRLNQNFGHVFGPTAGT